MSLFEKINILEKRYSYKPTGMLDEADELIEVGKQLATLGCLDSKHIGRYYTIHYHYAVKKFQRQMNLSPSGKMGSDVKSLIYVEYQKYINKYGDQVDSNVSAGGTGNSNAEPFIPEGNQYIEESFFSNQREATLRRNGYNIVVQIGDYDQYVKAITGVRLRSKTVQFDASGQPISETYEFIAKDLKENTEPTEKITK